MRRALRLPLKCLCNSFLPPLVVATANCHVFIRHCHHRYRFVFKTLYINMWFMRNKNTVCFQQFLHKNFYTSRRKAFSFLGQNNVLIKSTLFIPSPTINVSSSIKLTQNLFLYSTSEAASFIVTVFDHSQYSLQLLVL